VVRIVDIRNPLSIIRCECQRSVQVFLERASDAWNQACPEEALRVCYAADCRASECNDRAGTALAQIYLACAQAQGCNLEEGIKLAERAAVNFRLQGDRHNNVVAYLLLGRLKRASYNFEDARLDYQEALGLCQKLESEAKETARSDTAQLYAQIVEQVRQVLENIEIDRRQWLEVIWVAPDGRSLQADVLDAERNKICTRWMSAREFRDRTAVSWFWEGVVAEIVDSPAFTDLVREQIERPNLSLMHAYLLSRIADLLHPEVKDFHMGPCDLAQIEDEASTRLSMDLRRKRVAEGQIDVSYRDGQHLREYVEMPLQPKRSQMRFQAQTDTSYQEGQLPREHETMPVEAERPWLLSKEEEDQLIEHVVGRELLGQVSRGRWADEVQFTVLSDLRGWPEALRPGIAARWSSSGYANLTEVLEGSKEAESGEAKPELSNVRFELGWEPRALEESFYRGMATQGISIMGSVELEQRIVESLPATSLKKSLKGIDVRIWVSEMRVHYPSTPVEERALESEMKAEQHFLKRAKRVRQLMEEHEKR
jgi:tetratricopeptide (TPR) repeat protein